MPLPTDVRLSLQGPARPDDPVQSKPKKVMLVKMTAETLAALSDYPNNPQMDFQFDQGNTGVYIGETFYPMRTTGESSPSELYLRTATAAKPNAPLKLYGNVIGKINVERELDKVAEKVRDIATAANKQRDTRQTVMLESIPQTLTNGKKRKPAPPAKSQVRKSIGMPSSSLPARIASPAPNVSPQGPLSVREKMICAMALMPRTAQEVLAYVGEPPCSPSHKQELLALLRQIAEETPRPKSASSDTPPKYELRKHCWLEVKPYEWPALSDGDRLSIARKARLALSYLKIPKSEPVWQHVQTRPVGSAPTPPVSTSNPASGSNTPVQVQVKQVPRKPATKTKDAAAAGKGRAAKVDIQAKDEGSRTSGLSSKPKKETLAPTPAPAARQKLPGSGFKAPSSTPVPKRDSPVTVTVTQIEKKRTGPMDARADRRRDEPAPSGSARPAPPIPPPVSKLEEGRKPSTEVKVIKRPKTEATERAKEAIKQAKEAADKGKSRVVDEETRVRNEGVSGRKMLKRKKPAPRDEKEEEEGEEREHSHTKRRKMQEGVNREEEPLPRKPVKKARELDGDGDRQRERDKQWDRERDHGRVRGIDREGEREGERDRARGRGREKDRERDREREHGWDRERERERERVQDRERGRDRDSSPRPQKKVKREELSPSVSRDLHPDRHSLKLNGSSGHKPRRRSPIYTSSSDEGFTLPRKRELMSPPPSVDSRLPLPGPLPKDRQALRERYERSYPPYVSSYQRYVTRRSKLKDLLTRMEKSGEGTVSAGEEFELDLEEMKRVQREYKTWEEEMSNVMQAWKDAGEE